MKLKRRGINQLLLSLKVGDGCIICNTHHYKEGWLHVSSISVQYIVHKKVVLERLGIHTQPLRYTISGYKSSSIIYTFGTRVNPLITEVANLTIEEVVHRLDKQGLIYFYLDDGTFHQKKHFGHIYCNTFNDEEVSALIDKFYQYYPQKRCAKRMDRKKDGREYPYIYIPVSVMNEFKKDVANFLLKEHLDDLYYKVGGKEYVISKESRAK